MTLSEAEVAKRDAVDKWQSEFEHAGFDYECDDINFGDASAEAIEAMGAALRRLRLRGTAPLSFLELRSANVPRSVNDFGHLLEEWSETDWGCAAAGEVGEMCNLIKKRRRRTTPGFQSKQEAPTVEEVAKEAADVVIYLDLLMARMGIDLGEVVRHKFNIVSDRIGSEFKL